MEKKGYQYTEKDTSNQEYADNSREISFPKLSSLSKEEKIKIINFLKKDIDEGIYSVPVAIFDNNFLSSLESIVKYLKEELKLGNKEIAKILNRSDKTIWATYQKSRIKMGSPLILKHSDIFIPLNIFQKRKLSVLETIVVYLKNNYRFSYKDIAVIINRNYRTVATVYRRSKLKK